MKRARRWIHGKRSRSSQISIVGGIPPQTRSPNPDVHRQPSLRDEPPNSACRLGADVRTAVTRKSLRRSSGAGGRPFGRLMKRSKASKSARRPRSARKAAAFIAESFSATADATNASRVVPPSRATRSAASVSECGRCTVTSRSMADQPPLRMSPGPTTSMPNAAGTLPKSAQLNVTIASARPFTAASKTISSAGSRSRGRQR